MKRRKRSTAVPLPIMLAELALSSWETVSRRGWMMAQGACSAAEMRRMVAEKALAAYDCGLALASPRRRRSAAALLAPWHRRAVANARRLRPK